MSLGSEAAVRPAWLDLAPVARVGGVVRMPGSKSISNRLLLLSALAAGRTTLRDVLDSDDTRVMLQALRTLGVTLSAQALETGGEAGDEKAVDEKAGAGELQIEGCAGLPPVQQASLFLGNAGTAFRPLTAALAMACGEAVDYQLSGVARMHERPIGDLVDALRGLGCVIDYLGEPGFPPLRIGAANLRQAAQPVLVRGDVSSQFLSALLMALPLSGRAQRIEVVGELISKPYVELTLALMRRFGIAVVRHGWQAFDVPAQNYQSPGTVFVEGDASSASYFLAAGVLGGLLPQGASSTPVRIEGVGRDSIQGDVRFAEVLERMGGQLRMGPNWIEAETGPAARRAGHLQPLDMDLNHIPDAAMTAAVLALFAQGTSRLRNIGSWRVKETDRIAAMACELRKLGAQVEEGADFLAITPPRVWQPASIDTYDDHRMAMCFSLAALGGVALRIHDPACVGKTFPGYFAALASITGAKGSA